MIKTENKKLPSNKKNRLKWIKDFSKEFLHDTQNHLSIIDGFSKLLNNFECPSAMCQKNEHLPIIIKHTRQLSLLIKNVLSILKEYETNPQLNIREELNKIKNKTGEVNKMLIEQKINITELVNYIKKYEKISYHSPKVNQKIYELIPRIYAVQIEKNEQVFGYLTDKQG